MAPILTPTDRISRDLGNWEIAFFLLGVVVVVVDSNEQITCCGVISQGT